MKNLSILTCLFLLASSICYSQINIGSKLKNKTKQRAEKKTDQSIDKGLDEAEEEIGNLFGGKNQDKKDQAESETDETNPDNNEKSISESGTPDALLTWAKYDFIPGDKVIFEDNQLSEENGEFPSRWDLVGGTVENAKLGGDNVIMFRGGSPTIIPYLKNSDTDYLPDVFTVEFDLYVPGNSFTIYFYDRKNQKSPSSSANHLQIWPTSMEVYPAKSNIPGNKSIANKWSHIAIAYTNRKLKAYIDDTRLINIPHLDFNPTGISLHAYHASDHNLDCVKNFRIAEGGVKYYDRMLQDGKIVTNGIRFDVNKATIRPESMGVINSIYNLLEENPDLKFSVEGHTDNDGDNDSNQKLSEERAKAVMNKLVEMGIDKGRLNSKGFGESMPIDNNSTSEGKANNRRVEFVKI